LRYFVAVGTRTGPVGTKVDQPVSLAEAVFASDGIATPTITVVAGA
jgi:hypothetical protein